MIVYLDLWLTVRNPFYERQKRVKYYWAYLFIQTIFVLLGLFYIDHVFRIKIKTVEDAEVIDSDNNNNLVIMGLASTIYFAVALVSIIAVIFKISRPGTSRDLKAKVCKRYFFYMLFFLIWDVNQTYNIFDSFDERLMIAGALLGVPLALVRLFEPVVWEEFKSCLFCMKKTV
jgi:hypothetical protein